MGDSGSYLLGFNLAILSILASSPYHLQTSYESYVVNINFDKIGLTRHQLMTRLAERGVGSQVHYIPVHLQPYYKRQGFCSGMFENAENYFRNCLSLPLHQGLEEVDIKYVCDKLTIFLSKS